MTADRTSNSQRIVIGLDYGTTYTGVAYSDSAGSIRDIQIIFNWPGQYGHNAVNEKVPSQVAYGDFDGHTYTWGNHIPPNVPRQYWTKLQLDASSKKPRELRMLLALLSNDFSSMNLTDDDDDDSALPPAYPGKEPKDIVADYLTGVKEHVFQHLRTEFGPALFAACTLDVVITVPAVWSDKAKDLTFQAVTKAGFVGDKERIKMVTEPEAAATYTLKTLKSGAGGDDFKEGDHFVLCDAGGGTVDLLSYRVRSVSPDFRVEEAAVGTGDKCGSTFINRRFIDWLKKKLGEKTIERIPEEKLREGSRIFREFESAKMSFNGSPSKSYLTIPREAKVEDDPANGIEDGDLCMTEKDLEGLFDPSVNRTLELIDEQAAAVHATGSTVKYVFLVGGFGRSDYLLKKVEEYCTARGFIARRPPFPWSAVARGAVARGLEESGGGLVELRKCRYHYGTPVSEDFDPTRHLEKDAYFDELTGEKNAKGQMHWLFNKGDALHVSTPKRAAIACSRKFKSDEERVCTAQLAYCKDDGAPTRYMDEGTIQCSVHLASSNTNRRRSNRSDTPLHSQSRLKRCSGKQVHSRQVPERRRRILHCEF
jgi:molecular chaperone DnaK (HSP70)